MALPTPPEFERCRRLVVESDLPLSKIAQHSSTNIHTLKSRIQRYGWAQQKRDFRAGNSLEALRESQAMDRANAVRNYQRALAEEKQQLDYCWEANNTRPRTCSELDAYSERVEKAAARLKRLGILPKDVASKEGATVHTSKVADISGRRTQRKA